MGGRAVSGLLRAHSPLGHGENISITGGHTLECPKEGVVQETFCVWKVEANSIEHAAGAHSVRSGGAGWSSCPHLGPGATYQVIRGHDLGCPGVLCTGVSAFESIWRVGYSDAGFGMVQWVAGQFWACQGPVRSLDTVKTVQ